MEYATFIGRGQTSQVYRGIGADGPLLGELSHAFPLHDFSAAGRALLWVCGYAADGRGTFVERLTLPSMHREQITWRGGRVGALVTNRDGQQAVALELPQDTAGRPALWWWHGSGWIAAPDQVIPDISSRLAWLDGSRVVFESAQRRLCVLDLDGGKTEQGPISYYPAAAADIQQLYAISQGQVVCFPFMHLFDSPPAILHGFSFRHVTTLRVTHCGNVFTWTEPRFIYRSRGYIQRRGHCRMRFQPIDKAVGGVIGPFDKL